MSFLYDPDVAYTCGMGAGPDGAVSVTIGHELDVDTDRETFAFAFESGGLTITCSRELAAEIASAFAAVAEA